jgi:hypothetical protein
LDATALRLKLAIQFITQGCRSANPGLWDITALR